MFSSLHLKGTTIVTIYTEMTYLSRLPPFFDSEKLTEKKKVLDILKKYQNTTSLEFFIIL